MHIAVGFFAPQKTAIVFLQTIKGTVIAPKDDHALKEIRRGDHSPFRGMFPDHQTRIFVEDM